MKKYEVSKLELPQAGCGTDVYRPAILEIMLHHQHASIIEDTRPAILCILVAAGWGTRLVY